MSGTARWLEVSFVAPGAQTEAWSDALLAAGALSVRTEDADADGPLEQALFGEPGEPEGFHAWPSTRITALLDEASAPGDVLAAAARQAGFSAPDDFAVVALGERDWVAATQAQFEPIDIGVRLRITPSWHREQESAAAVTSDGRAQIVLDPGLAFGTGSHPTTGMCLAWLERELPAGATLIDYGCGTGILAIAAARLGASAVTAIDIDPQALQSTRDNAAANGVAVTVRAGDQPGCPSAQVVVANILASPLRLLAPMLESLVEPGGSLVLAGLLDRQVDEVAAAYCEIELRPYLSREGWTCLAGTKGPAADAT